MSECPQLQKVLSLPLGLCSLFFGTSNDPSHREQKVSLDSTFKGQRQQEAVGWGSQACPRRKDHVPR